MAAQSGRASAEAAEAPPPTAKCSTCGISEHCERHVVASGHARPRDHLAVVKNGGGVNPK